MNLSWDRLLCNKRPHRAGNGAVEGSKSRTLVRSAFDRDYGRIVFSTPFRRLSKKTQVHPFASIDFIWGRKYTEEALLQHRGDVMWWLHAATDHIVGMTDDYAQKTALLF